MDSDEESSSKSPKRVDLKRARRHPVVKHQRYPSLNRPQPTTDKGRKRELMLRLWCCDVSADIISYALKTEPSTIYKCIQWLEANPTTYDTLDDGRVTREGTVTERTLATGQAYIESVQSVWFPEFMHFMLSNNEKFSTTTYYSILRKLKYTPKTPSSIVAINDGAKMHKIADESKRILDIWDACTHIIACDEFSTPLLRMNEAAGWSEIGTMAPDKPFTYLNLQPATTFLMIGKEKTIGHTTKLTPFHSEDISTAYDAFLSKYLHDFSKTAIAELRKRGRPQREDQGARRVVIGILLDKAKVHTRTQLHRTIMEIRDRVTVHLLWLPPSAPEANPTEFKINSIKAAVLQHFQQRTGPCTTQSEYEDVITACIEEVDQHGNNENLFKHVKNHLSKLVKHGGDRTAALAEATPGIDIPLELVENWAIRTPESTNA